MYAPQAMAPQMSLKERLASLDIPLSNNPQHPLVSRIKNNLSETRLHHRNYFGQSFLPNDELDKLLTRDIISKLIILTANLSPCEMEPEIAAIVDQINPRDQRSRNHCRKRILAILILADIPISSIIHFIEAGIWDEHLPFQPSCNGQLEYIDEDERRITCPLPCFHNDQTKLDLFELLQCSYIVPSFNFTEDRIYHTVIPDQVPLPIEKGRDLIQTPGGNSSVSQVVIHHSHHDLGNGRQFALKMLLSSTDEDFNKEVEALKLVRKLRCPHIIELLGTFKYRSCYYLIFRWAVDDLKGFWQSKSTSTLDSTMSTWALQQCLGIAKGLEMIHSGQCSASGPSILKGRHGDIKPANILRYAPRMDSQDPMWGVLKISDFGLSRFHRNQSCQREYANGMLATRTYRAPEGDLKRKISYLWDLWSLGCLYLEFLTWLLHGWEGVAAFSEEREREDQSHYQEVYEDKFFNLTNKKQFGACIKESVKRHIDALHKHPECTDLIHDFLDLIAEGLIRIRPDERTKCHEIVQKLEVMRGKCTDNEHYYTKGQKRFTTRKTCESDKSCNPTAPFSNPGHVHHHEISGRDSDNSSKTLGLASESGDEEKSIKKTKNQQQKQGYLRRVLDFLKACC